MADPEWVLNHSTSPRRVIQQNPTVSWMVERNEPRDDWFLGRVGDVGQKPVRGAQIPLQMESTQCGVGVAADL